ncbi:MAG: TonB-dependent receptor [candidate division Zixibacteria bacterium]|nr:TonB-dependent receptor [candidate division Zixibacteria bacterium]
MDKTNPNLGLERIHSGELIWEQGIGPYLQATAAGFLYRIDGLISQVEDPANGLLVYRNLERIETYGMEMELEGQASPGLRGRASYSFQRIPDVFKGRHLTNSPEHLFKWNLAVPVPRTGVIAGMEFQYVSRRATEAGGWAPQYHTTHLTVTRDNILPHVDVTASVYNLFGNRIRHPGTGEHLQELIEQDGRTARARLTFRF